MGIILGFEPSLISMRCENSLMPQALRWSLGKCVTIDHGEVPKSMEFLLSI